MRGCLINNLCSSCNYEEPNEESLSAMREADEMRKAGSDKACSSGCELIEAALAWANALK